MLRIGLTGSIGMGKTETARLFASYGWPCFDADATVHQLYSAGGRAVPLVNRRFPEAVVAGSVDRRRLSDMVLGDPAALADLENIVHPLVRSEQQHFSEQAESRGAEAVVFDIPLLLEQGRQHEFDATVVVSAPPEVQRDRVLARPGMTADKLAAILRSQLPDNEKRRRADFVVDTGAGHESAARQVAQIVSAIRQRYGLRHDT